MHSLALSVRYNYKQHSHYINPHIERDELLQRAICEKVYTDSNMNNNREIFCILLLSQFWRCYRGYLVFTFNFLRTYSQMNVILLKKLAHCSMDPVSICIKDYNSCYKGRFYLSRSVCGLIIGTSASEKA